MNSPIAFMIVRSTREVPKVEVSPVEDSTNKDTCPICMGRGSVGVKRDDKTPDGSIRAVLEEVPCSNCDGTGKIAPKSEVSDVVPELDKPDDDEDDEKEYTGIFAEAGTKASGFVSNGKQYCGDCVHQLSLEDGKNLACYHPAVMADQELQDRKQKDGGIKVTEDECCRYIRKSDGK